MDPKANEYLEECIKKNSKKMVIAHCNCKDRALSVKEKLLEKLPEFDFIVTPEAKSIPLAYEMARQSGKKYFVARKKAKLYMKDPVSVNVRSITTASEQTLILDGVEGEQIRGKRVVILDDVISTGESLKAVEELCAKFDADIVAKAAVLAEGDAAERTDIVYLGVIPLIEK